MNSLHRKRVRQTVLWTVMTLVCATVAQFPLAEAIFGTLATLAGAIAVGQLLILLLWFDQPIEFGKHLQKFGGIEASLYGYDDAPAPPPAIETDATKPGSTPGDAIAPPEMTVAAEQVGVAKTNKDGVTIFGLAIMAGIFIGLGFAFYITVTTGANGFPWGISRLIGGLVFSMGLALIVVCGGELFTSAILTSVACASGHFGPRRMIRHWTLVYLGNLVGALVLAGLMFAGKVHELNDGAWGLNLMQVARHKLHHGFIEAVALGALCNMLVCLAVWMTYSTRRIGEKALLIMLPVAMFVATGFEHIVANMFVVPLGIAANAGADADFWLRVGARPENFAELTVMQFFTANVVPVTLGNILGGLMIGLGNWLLYRRKAVLRSRSAFAASRAR